MESLLLLVVLFVRRISSSVPDDPLVAEEADLMLSPRIRGSFSAFSSASRTTFFSSLDSVGSFGRSETIMSIEIHVFVF
jgi:hypothetical protein